MFYLELKDGERFFTAPKSNDRLEFEKILEQKLGEQAVELFNRLLTDAADDGYSEGYGAGRSNPF